MISRKLSATVMLIVWGILIGVAFGQPQSSKRQSIIDPMLIEVFQNTDEAQVIIALKDPVPLDALLEARRRAIAEAQQRILALLTPGEFTLLWQYDVLPALAGTIRKSGLDKLANHPSIVSIYPDHPLVLIPIERMVEGLSVIQAHSDVLKTQMRPLLAEGASLINADDLHNKGVTGSGVVVAVFDTGIDFSHPELNDGATIVASACFTSVGCSSQDTYGHGTPVSGVITANGGRSMPNGQRTPKGVAYNAKLVVAKVIDPPRGSESSVIAGLNWILGNPSFGVSIINMSLGLTSTLYSGQCDGSHPATFNAIQQAKVRGIITFAASGNDGSSTSMLAPACLSNVISVLAVDDQTDQVTDYSNTNPYTDIAAPAYLTTTTSLMSYCGEGLCGVETRHGTSLASPYAAAVAALMKQANPSITPDQIEQVLKSSGVPVLDTKNNLTFSRLDAFSALFIEIGEVNVDYNWITVSLKRRFASPVVVAKPIGFSDTRPAVVRIRNVSATSFQIRIQNWDYLPDNHGYERVGYIVMEKGFYSLKGKGGVNYEVAAGTVNTSCTHSCWATAYYDGTFSSTPIVISSVMTVNESQAVDTRNANVYRNRFSVQMQEQERNTQSHLTETIGFIAWTPTNSTTASQYFVDGKIFQVWRTGSVVTDAWRFVGFNSAISGTGRIPVFIADMQTKNGSDPSNVRWRNKSTSGVEVKIAEEQSYDSETSHPNAENVGWLAFACVMCTISFSPSAVLLDAEVDWKLPQNELVIHRIKTIPSPRLSGMIFEVYGRKIASIQVEIYTLAGKRVWDSGSVTGQSVQWNGLDTQGKPMANGVYLYILRARSQEGKIVGRVQKLVVLR